MSAHGGRGVEHLLTDVIAWAGAQPDVRAVALVGSYARGNQRPDSDVDLVLMVDDVDGRLGDRSWLATFGEPVSGGVEPYGLVRSLRTRFGAGVRVEVGLTSLAWVTPPIDEVTAAAMRAGLVAVDDPTGLLAAALEDVGP